MQDNDDITGKSSASILNDGFIIDLTSDDEENLPSFTDFCNKFRRPHGIAVLPDVDEKGVMDLTQEIDEIKVSSPIKTDNWSELDEMETVYWNATEAGMQCDGWDTETLIAEYEKEDNKMWRETYAFDFFGDGKQFNKKYASNIERIMDHNTLVYKKFKVGKILDDTFEEELTVDNANLFTIEEVN